MWEKNIDIHEVREIRVKTTAFLGVGAIEKINFIAEELVKLGVDKLLVMTGRSAYKSCGAWDHVEKALANNKIEYVHYDRVTPNPEADQVDEATKMARDFGAKAVIAIGGGSPTDAAKAVAILLKYPEQDARALCNMKFAFEKAVPIIAINLTHGTGTEVDRFSVVTVPETQHKPALAADCMYPLYAIDDPQLMVGLSPKQTTYVTVDAINHITEACSTSVTNPFAILLAKEVVRLVAKYLPRVQKDPADLEARYFLAYAAMMAGTSFDNGLLHLTHALEHPLSGMKPETTHGLGLGVLLPAVVKNIYAVRKDTLFEVLQPLLGDLDFETATAEDVAKGIRTWLHSVGVTENLTDLGFKETDIDQLAKLAFETPGLEGLLQIAPVEVDENVVKQIYKDSF